MRKEDIIELLKSSREKLEEYGVKRIGIFGSAVRNEIGQESDIDIVVEFEENRGGFRDFGGVIEFLEKLFGREIDILTPLGIDSIRIKPVRERIKGEIEYV